MAGKFTSILLRRAQLAGLSGQWVALLSDELEYDGQVLSRSAGVAQRKSAISALTGVSPDATRTKPRISPAGRAKIAAA
jgi:hypothetical protein